jgi:peroxiredoxin Q/BCP
MKPAPHFSLPDQTGATRSLSDFSGRWLVVYFYPKDDTPGCTTEACSFRDEYGYLQEQGLEILGISKDTVRSHAKFAEKYDLKFPLLSDRSLETIKAFGAWGRKKFMGREYDGILRTTFLINPGGQIVKRYDDVTPKEHAVQIKEDFEALRQ